MYRRAAGKGGRTYSSPNRDALFADIVRSVLQKEVRGRLKELEERSYGYK